MGFKCPYCGGNHSLSTTYCIETGEKIDYYLKYLGRNLKGKYKIKRFIAEGGMGSIFEAEHMDLERTFAIKTLHPRYASDHDTAVRFKREAKAAAKVKHEHIIGVSDIDEDEDGVPFMVMELLEGENLYERITRKGKIPPVEAVDIALQILSALSSTHRSGIIHRDLKPENVFLTRFAGKESWVKLLDFGLAKFKESPGAKSLTKKDVVLGTPGFMAPEQINKQSPIDARTDIYSCGLLLYNALTGVMPFDTSMVHTMFYEIIDKVPDHPSDVEPSVPRDLGDVVMKAIEKKPYRRFQTAGEMMDALLPFGSGEYSFTSEAVESPGAVEAASIGVMPTTAQSTPAPVLSTGYTTTVRSFSGKRKTVIITLAVLVVVTAVVALVSVRFIHQTSRSRPDPARAIPAVSGTAEQSAEKPSPGFEAAGAAAGPADEGIVTLKVTAEPAGAAILLDGAVLQGNPHESSVKVGDALHKLEVSHEGYAVHTEWLKFDGPIERHILLEEVHRPASVKVTTKHPPKVEKKKPFGYVDKNPYGKK